MKNFRENKGITLIALIITIVVLLIIAGISISGGIEGIDKADDNRAVTELEKVQHAITERYTKFQLTKDTSVIVGTKVDTLPTLPTPAGEAEAPTWKVFQGGNDENLKPLPEREYYRLSKSDLENLGLTGDYKKSSYIVNYYSGEVFDETVQTTSKGNILYKSAIDSEASAFGDDYVKNGMLVWYDAINNTGSGHSGSTTTWKDLSGNGNDAELNGFDGTATSGWHSNYLAFDGQNDWGKTVKELDYNSSKELTIECVDIDGGLSNNTSTSVIAESSSNFNNSKRSFYTGVESDKKISFTFNKKIGGVYYYGRRTNGNILPLENVCKYCFVLNTANSNKNFIKIYKNNEELSLNVSRDENIIDSLIDNYIMYIGARNGESLFTKMNLANFKVYNKALTNDEIYHNYILDKNRYGIEE